MQRVYDDNDIVQTEQDEYDLACKVARVLYKKRRLPKKTLLEFDDYVAIAWWEIRKKVKKGVVYRGNLYVSAMYRVRHMIIVHREKRQNMLPISDVNIDWRKIHHNQPLAIDEIDNSEKRKLLRIWCKTSNSRRNGNWLGRLLAYLHLVELIPIDELSRMFGITEKSLPTKIGMNLYLARKYYMSDKERSYQYDLS